MPDLSEPTQNRRNRPSEGQTVAMQKPMSAASGSRTPSDRLSNNLGLSAAELTKLLDRLDRDEVQRATPSARREYVRWIFRQTSVVLELSPSVGETVTFQVASRNLSCGGIGILHRAYVHPGTPCRILLPHPDRGYTPVSATTVRCRHCVGVIHEVGLVFDEYLSVREFVSVDPFEDCFSLERVDSDKLEGRVLLATDSSMDRKLLEHYLRQTRLRIRSVESVERAMESSLDECDILLCDSRMENGKGMKLVQYVRECHPDLPVVALVGSTTPEVRSQLVSSGADAFLVKPITQQYLLRGLAEYLVLRRPGDIGHPRAHQVGVDREAIPAVFAKELGDYAVRIGAAIEAGDFETCRKLCSEIGGTAPSIGLGKLADLADRCALAIENGVDAQAIGPLLDGVVRGCRRAA